MVWDYARCFADAAALVAQEPRDLYVGCPKRYIIFGYSSVIAPLGKPMKLNDRTLGHWLLDMNVRVAIAYALLLIVFLLAFAVFAK